MSDYLRDYGAGTPEMTDDVSNGSDDDDITTADNYDDSSSGGDYGPTIQTDPTAENYNKWKAQGYWTLTFQKMFPSEAEFSVQFTVETSVEPHPELKELLAHYSNGTAARHLNAPVVDAERENSSSSSPEFRRWCSCSPCQEAEASAAAMEDNQESNVNEPPANGGNRNENQAVEYTRGSRGGWSITFERTFSDMSTSGIVVASDVKPHPLLDKVWRYYEVCDLLKERVPPEPEVEGEQREEWLNQNCQQMQMQPERGPRDRDDDDEYSYDGSYHSDQHEGDKEGDLQGPPVGQEVVDGEENEEECGLEPVVVVAGNRGLQGPQYGSIRALLKMENVLKEEQGKLGGDKRETQVAHQNALVELKTEINQYIEGLKVTKSDLKECLRYGCVMAYKWRALGKALENYKEELQHVSQCCKCKVKWVVFQELKKSVIDIFEEEAFQPEVDVTSATASSSSPNGNPVPMSSNRLDGSDWFNF